MYSYTTVVSMFMPMNLSAIRDHILIMNSMLYLKVNSPHTLFLPSSCFLYSG